MNLEPQPRFPEQDLSKNNAERLSLLLCDETMLEALHEQAEAIQSSYKIGHDLAGNLLQLSEQFSEEQLAAIHYGMSVQEATSSLVQHLMEAEETQSLEQSGRARLQIVSSLGSISNDPFNALDELDDNFRNQHPIGSELIGELAEDNFPRNCTDDAIAGAALARHLELKAAGARG